jgi:tetratricopeptide (TPR) repeat protein
MEWFSAEEHVDRALDLYERGRWADAEAELRKAIAVNPDQGEWHFNLGLTLEADGRETEALACYLRAVELLPEESQPLIAAGITANRLGRYAHAIEWLQRAVRLDPASEAAYAHQMDSLIRMGRLDEAETLFYLAQQHVSEAPNCLLMMAEILIQGRQWDRAGWCLREALRLEPALHRARARLGTVLAASGQPDRALQMFLRDLRDDPGNVETLLDLADLLTELNRLPDAAEKLRRVLELQPANVEAHLRLGRIALQARRYDEAHVEFELVLKLDPDYPQVRLVLAEVLLQRRRLDEARAHLRDELGRMAPDDAGADLPALGELLLRADLAAEAVSVFELAIQRKPGTADLLRRLALARFRSGDRRGGIRTARQVLRLDPHCVASCHNLALAALEEGRARRAGAWLQHGLRQDHHDEGLRRLRMRWWLATARRWLPWLRKV